MNGYFKSESGKVKAERGSTRWVYNNFLRKQTKLRWVCGLCNVWCKDENGFKCHLEHENHIRRSEISRKSKAPEFKMTPRDEAFAASFVQYIAQNYLNRKVLLHDVYREMYPDDRFQRLMHDTCWGSLGTFINALSKAGECEAVKGPKGWVVRIDQEMLIAAESEREERMERVEAGQGNPLEADEGEDLDEPSCFLAQDDATAPVVPESRSKRMQASWASTLNQPARKWRKDDGGARRAAALAREAAAAPADKASTEAEAATSAASASDANRGKVAFQLCAGKKARPPPAKVQQSRWPPGLVVKVLCREVLGGQAFGLKAVTQATEDGFVQVRLLKPVEGQDVVSVKEEQLETVLPKFGSRVMILDQDQGVKGVQEGILQSVETDSYSCTVLLGDSCTVSGLPYERVCKIWAG